MKKTIANGLARFEYHLAKLETLLSDAAEQADPSFFLYQNGARTPVFMLEGLAKLYGGLHNEKRFAKIKAHFKQLEDGLGAIDYYDGFAKQFSQDKTVPPAVTDLVRSKGVERAAAMNGLLTQNGWIGKDADRIAKIRKKLRDADWLDDKHEIKAIESFYRESIGTINAFAMTYRKGFTELESQVHELRRKIRWLSIYPQALQGCIQLTDTASNDKNVAKYLTSEIVNSPFNKMPAIGTNRYSLSLNRDYFFALSWMIAELGTLKDDGKRFVVLNEVGVKSAADKKAEAAILKRASEICRTYFDEKNLDKLISGIEIT